MRLNGMMMCMAMVAAVFAAGNARAEVRGLVAAVYSPFSADGALDVSKVRSQAVYLNATGVHKVLVAGTTGESVKMTTKERKDLLEEWVKVAPEFGIQVYAHVGTNALADAQELAKHAENQCVVANVAMSSTYFRPGTVQQLALEMQAIAGAAPSTPFFQYHIPAMTLLGADPGAGLSMPEFLGITTDPASSYYIPNLAGIKYSDYNIFEFSECQRFTSVNGQSYDILYGRDEQLLAAAAMRAVGAVGSTYNLVGHIANRVLDALHDGRLEDARKEQDKIVDLVAIYGDPAFAGTDVGKAILHHILKVEVGPPRLPAIAMTDAQVELLKQAVKAARIFE